MTSLVPFFRPKSWLSVQADDFLSGFFEGFDLQLTRAQENEFMPKIDVSETDSEFIVRAEVPGLAKDDIGIALSHGLLTLSGEKKHESEDKNENYHVIERRYGFFRRSMKFPDAIKAEEINASYENGLLTVTIPKPVMEQKKKIEIKR